LRPFQLVAHVLKDIGKHRERLDARIPVLLFECLG